MEISTEKRKDISSSNLYGFVCNLEFYKALPFKENPKNIFCVALKKTFFMDAASIHFELCLQFKLKTAKKKNNLLNSPKFSFHPHLNPFSCRISDYKPEWVTHKIWKRKKRNSGTKGKLENNPIRVLSKCFMCNWDYNVNFSQGRECVTTFCSREVNYEYLVIIFTYPSLR